MTPIVQGSDDLPEKKPHSAASCLQLALLTSGCQYSRPWNKNFSIQFRALRCMYSELSRVSLVWETSSRRHLE